MTKPTKRGLELDVTVPRAWCDARGLRSGNGEYKTAADHIFSAVHEVMAHEGVTGDGGRTVDVQIIGGGGPPTLHIRLQGRAVPKAIHDTIVATFERAMAQFQEIKK